MRSLAWYTLAALLEIAGCFAFWSCLRRGAQPAWMAAGLVSLAVFAWALTRVDSESAGRAYAAYGGIYILSSLVWMWAAEGQAPDRWDMAGAAVCLGGAALILWGPRG